LNNLAEARVRLRSNQLSLSETQSGWQVESNWVILLVDERCLQPDLVGADRIVPVASVAASRDIDARHQLNVLRRKSPQRLGSPASTVWYLPGCIGWHLACWTL
jgi:hypothetical protein